MLATSAPHVADSRTHTERTYTAAEYQFLNFLVGRAEYYRARAEQAESEGDALAAAKAQVEAERDALAAMQTWTDALMANANLNQGQRVFLYTAARLANFNPLAPEPARETRVTRAQFERAGVSPTTASKNIRQFADAGVLRRRTNTIRGPDGDVVRTELFIAPAPKLAAARLIALPDQPTRGGHRPRCERCGSDELETVTRCRGCGHIQGQTPESVGFADGASYTAPAGIIELLSDAEQRKTRINTPEYQNGIPVETPSPEYQIGSVKAESEPDYQLGIPVDVPPVDGPLASGPETEGTSIGHPAPLHIPSASPRAMDDRRAFAGAVRALAKLAPDLSRSAIRAHLRWKQAAFAGEVVNALVYQARDAGELDTLLAAAEPLVTTRIGTVTLLHRTDGEAGGRLLIPVRSGDVTRAHRVVAKLAPGLSSWPILSTGPVRLPCGPWATLWVLALPDAPIPPGPPQWRALATLFGTLAPRPKLRRRQSSTRVELVTRVEGCTNVQPMPTKREVYAYYAEQHPVAGQLEFNQKGYAAMPGRDHAKDPKLQLQRDSGGCYDHRTGERYDALALAAILADRDPRDLFAEAARELRRLRASSYRAS